MGMVKCAINTSTIIGAFAADKLLIKGLGLCINERVVVDRIIGSH